MGCGLALAQCGYPADGDVMEQVERYAAQAADVGAALLAFPENLMLPRDASPEQIAAIAEPLDGPFATGIARIAADHGLWIVFTMVERHEPSANGKPLAEPSADGKPLAGPSADRKPLAKPFTEGKPLAGSAPYNAAIVVDDAGAIRRVYHKCHLYDAHGVRESNRYTLGDALCEPLVAPFATLALGICYDLRFPETLRAHAGSFEMALLPACWHDGPNKAQHWETLLRARAIENECFVAGICRCGTGLVERSMVIDPLGEVVARANEGEALVVADVEPQDVAHAREAMPVFEHRRPELYGNS